ncbi:hypothetical protein GEMRC1_006536 [Eukaryota sp. GEM-RC1]
MHSQSKTIHLPNQVLFKILSYRLTHLYAAFTSSSSPLDFSNLHHLVGELFQSVGLLSKSFFQLASAAVGLFVTRHRFEVHIGNLSEYDAFCHFFQASLNSVHLNCFRHSFKESDLQGSLISKANIKSLVVHSPINFDCLIPSTSDFCPNLNRIKAFELGTQGAVTLSKALLVNSTCTNVDISHNWIQPEGLFEIADFFLDLTNNFIGTEGVVYLAESLFNNRTLKKLYVGSNCIKDEGLIALTRVLTFNSTIAVLDVCGNSITDVGCIALSKVLGKTTLSELDLGDNSISSVGLISLSEELKYFKYLESLNLEYNSLGTAGIIALANSLEVNYTLSYLNLSGNSIDDRATSALASCLKVNSALSYLYLEDNKISNVGAMNLMESIEGNPVISKVKLTFNSVDSSTMESVSSKVIFDLMYFQCFFLYFWSNIVLFPLTNGPCQMDYHSDNSLIFFKFCD